MCLAAPSNAYFHAFCENPFYHPFECIQRKYLAFNVAHMKIHYSMIGSLPSQHLAVLRNIQFFLVSLLKRYIEVFKDQLERSSFRN